MRESRVAAAANEREAWPVLPVVRGGAREGCGTRQKMGHAILLRLEQLEWDASRLEDARGGVGGRGFNW